MTLIAIFAISGLSLTILLVAKNLERRRRRPLFILSLISRGDMRTRKLYHILVHAYYEGKEKAGFLITKQLPMRLKNFVNKSATFVETKRAEYLNRMRDSRLIKKQEGISEFFKNMSEVEKGGGEINDVFEGSQEEKKEVK